MQHVADDGYREVAKVFFVVPDGVHVEQALRRVGVAAITGVDDVYMRGSMLGYQIRRAGLAVPHHKNICRHGAQV